MKSAGYNDFNSFYGAVLVSAQSAYLPIAGLSSDNVHMISQNKSQSHLKVTISVV